MALCDNDSLEACGGFNDLLRRFDTRTAGSAGSDFAFLLYQLLIKNQNLAVVGETLNLPTTMVVEIQKGIDALALVEEERDKVQKRLKRMYGV